MQASRRADDTDHDRVAWECVERQLDAALSLQATEHLKRAHEFSDRRLQDLRHVVAEWVLHQPPQVHRLGWIVEGSLARRESLDPSDVDLVMICPTESEDPDLTEVDQALRRHIRGRLGVAVSEGRNLTSPLVVQSVASASTIGGLCDTVQLLTKRILLLTESAWVYNEAAWRDAREKVLGAYISSATTRRRYLIAFCYDLCRFHRTLGIDYKSKVDAEMKPWAPRYLKLRHSRKFWYFSTVVAVVREIARSELDDDASARGVLDCLEQPPIVRYVLALGPGAPACRFAPLPYLNRFVGELGSERVREELSGVIHDARHTSESFRRLKGNADRLRRSLIETFDDLPAQWRRHMLHLFMF